MNDLKKNNLDNLFIHLKDKARINVSHILVSIYN